MTTHPQNAQGAYVEYKRTAIFDNLDGLRFLSIMAVIWHHTTHLFGALEGAPRMARAGFLGVDLFFVLSGFLITALLLREADRNGAISLRDFWRRRVRRILPAYFVLLGFVAMYFVGLKGRHEDAELLIYYALFISNFLDVNLPFMTVTWSLAVEMQFYLLWPIVLLLTPRRWLVPATLALIAINVLGVMQVFAPLGVAPVTAGPLTFQLPNATFAPLLMGALVAILLHNRSTFAALWRVFGSWAAAPAALATLLIMIEFAPSDMRGLPNLAIHTAMCALVAACVLSARNALSPFLTLSPVRRIGEISYGIYLYHLIAMHFAVKIAETMPNVSPWVTFTLVCVISVGMAEASHRTVESYFTRCSGHGIGATRFAFANQLWTRLKVRTDV
jgi:peptidoglycan/LPS O-acetylase OafA/YrhL